MFVPRLRPQHTRVTPRAICVALSQGPEERGEVLEGREEDLGGAVTGGVGVVFGVGDEFLGEALGFFGFGPGCCYGFVLYEGGDEVAEEGLPVGGVPA